MMTTRELARLIDVEAFLKVNDLSFKVTIQDVKEAYGTTRYLVKPVSGSGETWVQNLNIPKEITSCH